MVKVMIIRPIAAGRLARPRISSTGNRCSAYLPNSTVTGLRAVWANQGDGEYYGIEFETNYALNDMWTVGGYVTYTINQYKDFCDPDAPDYFSDATATTNTLTILTPAADGTVYECGIVDGNEIPNQPKVTANFNVNATLPNDIFGLRTSLRADWRYTGASYQDSMNYLRSSDVGTVNISANMRNDNWTLRLFVNNILDTDYPGSIGLATMYEDNVDPSQAAVQSGGYSVIRRMPREVGLQVNYNF